MLDDHISPCGDSVEQFLHILIIQRHAAPGPISVRATTVNEDVAPQPRLLGRNGLLTNRIHDLVVLLLINESVA